MGKFTHHVFVCDNARPESGRPACRGRGAAEILAAFRAQLGAHPDLWERVAITPTGCLGPCFDGPNAVVYPEGIWYRGMQVADVPAIVRDHLVGGRPLARLIDDDDDDDDE